MKGNVLETVMGAVVLVVAALFLFFAYNTSQLRSVQGYELTADFERIDGIRDGGDVRVSGIKIGEIVSAGLLGDKYLSLVPGGSDTLIPAGGRIKYTQSSVTLENLIGQMIFSNPGAKKGAEGEAPADQQGQAPQAHPSGPAAPAKR